MPVVVAIGRLDVIIVLQCVVVRVITVPRNIVKIVTMAKNITSLIARNVRWSIALNVNWMMSRQMQANFEDKI